MLKPRGAVCNLDCHYCFYLRKEALYPQSSFRMSDELLESYTRQYIAAQRVPEVTFAWQGGEPTLMGLDFYRKAVEYQARYRRPGMLIHNNFQTNGTLLNAEWCQFFHEHDFLIGLSLDGPQDLHDAYRVDKGGRATFQRVLAAARLMQEHSVEFNILACVNNLNARRPLDVYRFLRDEVGAKFIQFIPIVEPDPTAPGGVSPRSVSGRDYGFFLNAIFDEWVRRDVGSVFVQIFDVALAAWSGSRPGLCIFDETCGTAMAMEHNGDLYACDHFVAPPYRLGNILETPLADLVGDPRQVQFGLDKKASLPRTCRECPVRFVCNGGCPKDRLLTAPSGEPGLNILCDGFKSFFTHIDAPMRTMADLLRQHRPAAEIMPTLPPLGRKRHR
jgi:uncharacterized protein